MMPRAIYSGPLTDSTRWNAVPLRRGDVIVQAGLDPVTTPADVAAAVDSAKQQDRKAVLVLVSREEEERFVTLPLRDA